ncbi:hypothetical protein AAG570_007790 [Ranatra chinensis]|uniref:Uncharacterized protein n=1 Tax=Ranatra chinensis TaxID=642074 RepID=A0ABD0XUJ6_9HEMI
MKPRYSIAPAEFGSEEQPDYQPIAITSVYENIPFRTTNPKRKLRRLQTEKGYENYDPSIVLSRGDLPFRKVEAGCRPVAAERLRIVDASESQPFLTAPGDGLLDGRRVNGEHESKPVLACPLSPTNYQQPPTPDHPPPSATQAENSIHERIRPLSEVITYFHFKPPN